jgi:serine/threonine protein kinase/tetratricopeptide (TPR) repeat protein
MKTAHSNQKSGTAELVAKAADEFLKAAEAGSPPKIDEFVERYPQIAAILRDVIPALAIINPSLSGNKEKPLGTDDLIDRTLGDFRLIREIGRGGMGVVYEAEQISLGRSVALKVLPFAGVLDEKQLQRFKNEARAAAALDHPHIVPVYSVGSERGVHYYAMRLIDGQSLAEILDLIPDYRADRTADGNRKSQVGARKSEVGDRKFKAVAGRAMCDPLSPSPVTGKGRGEGEELPSDTTSPSAAHLAPRPAPLASDTRPNLQSIITTNAGFDSVVYVRNVARLGIQAAEALAYAHEQSIVHRDIKPGNLLLDINGDLWVADFGLARLEQDAGITVTGDMLGTLRYMSPEQALGRRVLDERSDVYSLGITLYEMLVLRPAFSGHDRQEILRHITTDEPMPPRQINSRIPRDFETIILRAIAKDPTNRYSTAAELADDLERFLNDQPIHARRPTPVEKCIKWGRRHPAAVWATILVLFATTIVSGVSAALIIAAWNRESAARKAAEENARQAKANSEKAVANGRKAKAVQELLVAALRSPDPRRDGRTITVAEVLDAAAKSLDKHLSSDLPLKAHLLATIGESYDGLGLWIEAVPIFEEVHRLRVQALGPNDLDTIEAMNALAVADWRAGRFDAAIPLFVNVLNIRKAKLAPDDPALLTSRHNLALIYRDVGRIGDSVAMFEEVLKWRRIKPGIDDPNTLITMGNLASAYSHAGRIKEAIALSEETRDRLKAKFGPLHPYSLVASNQLAIDLAHDRRFDEAIALHKENLEAFQKVLGADNPDTLSSMHNLADAYSSSGKLDLAIPLYEKTVAMRKAKLTVQHPNTLKVMSNLANTYVRVGRLKDAIPVFEEVAAVRKSQIGVDPVAAFQAMSELAYAYGDAGRSADAERTLRELVERERRVLHADDLHIAEALARLALILLREEKFSDAEPIARECLEIREKKQADDWTTFSTKSTLGAALLGQRKFVDAEPLLLAGHEGMSARAVKIPEQSKRYLKDVVDRLVQLYEATDQPEKAAEWKGKRIPTSK